MLRPTIFACLAALAVATPAAHAAPIFPGASGVGLEPPPGMKTAKAFDGFLGGPASIVITEMPKTAYAQIDQSRQMFVTRFGAKQADDIAVNGAHGFMIKGMQANGPASFRKWIVVLEGPDETAFVNAQVPFHDPTYTDAAIEAALKTIAFRPRPGLDQQVAALPFAVGDLAGFRIAGAALNAALILVDGPKNVDPNQTQAQVVVALNGGAPPKTDRGGYAEAQLKSFQAIRTTKIDGTKLFDANGAQWAEVDASGTEGPNETPVAITYYLRFEADDSIAVFCVAPQGEAAKEAARFKTVALSVKPKA